MGGPAEPPQLWEPPQGPPAGPTHCRCSRSRAAPCGGRSAAPARPRSCGEGGGLGGPQFWGCPGAGGSSLTPSGSRGLRASRWRCRPWPHPAPGWGRGGGSGSPSTAPWSRWSLGEKRGSGEKKGDQGGKRGCRGVPGLAGSPPSHSLTRHDDSGFLVELDTVHLLWEKQGISASPPRQDPKSPSPNRPPFPPHPGVAPVLADHLPRGHVPERHGLVGAAGADLAVVEGPGGARGVP